MKVPEISVIVASFNHAKWIERCLRSLAHQVHMHHEEYEIIVINDGSTDETSEILERYKKIKNIRIITNLENKGLPASINIGMQQAEGRYVVRVDSDDYVSRMFLYLLRAFLNYNKEYQAVACDYLVVNENEEAISKNNSIEYEIACGVMFRKEALFDIGLYNELFKMREGHELRKRFLEKFTIGRLEFPLYKYRQHGANRTLDKATLEKYDHMLQVKRNGD